MNDTPLAGVIRPCCLCMSRFDVATMSQPGPGLWACLGRQGCAARQDALGPQREFADASVAPGTSPGAIAAFTEQQRAALAAGRDAQKAVA